MSNYKINKKRLVNYFFNLIKIDSPSSNEKKIVNYLKKILKNDFNLKSQVDSVGNIYVDIPGQGESILLCAHTDTVEPGRNIKPIINRQGKITSQGKTILGIDNKAAIAVILEVLRVLKENNIPHLPIELLFTTGEEVGCLGAKFFDYSKINSVRGVTIDNYDAPIGTITTKSFYYQTTDIEIIGRGAHAGDYFLDNAINSACALDMTIDSLSRIKTGMVSKNTSLSFGKIIGGHARNSIIDNIILHAEIRTLDLKELKQLNNYLAKTFKDTVFKKRGRVKIVNNLLVDGYEISSKSSFLKFVKDKFKQLHISTNEVVGGSDANVLIKKGIETIDLSIGGKNAHQINEEIKVKELEDMVLFLLTLLSV